MRVEADVLADVADIFANRTATWPRERRLAEDVSDLIAERRRLHATLAAVRAKLAWLGDSAEIARTFTRCNTDHDIAARIAYGHKLAAEHVARVLDRGGTP